MWSAGAWHHTAAGTPDGPGAPAGLVRRHACLNSSVVIGDMQPAHHLTRLGGGILSSQ